MKEYYEFTPARIKDEPNQLVLDIRDTEDLWFLASLVRCFQVEQVDFKVKRMNHGNRTEVTLSIHSIETEKE